MQLEWIGVVLAGALAGGLVNGLTGFGTGITAMGIWLYVLSPPVAASLVILCSVAAQMQTLPMIFGSIDWRGAARFVVPGIIGVPVGIALLTYIDPRAFRIWIGVLLILYSTTTLAIPASTIRRQTLPIADAVVGLAGGILGGLAGLSGVLAAVWTDRLGLTKVERRSLLQAFNLSVLAAALVGHGLGGLLTREVWLATATALPGTFAGAWLGSRIFLRLGDLGYRRAIMVLLFISGCGLIWSSR